MMNNLSTANSLEYMLMHKNTPVAVLSFTAGKLTNATKININEKYVPLGCYKDKHIIAWWNSRSVPKTRKGINKVLYALNLPDTESLILNNLGLSLTDCYWIRPIDRDIKWEDVNLFTNFFSDIMTDISFQNAQFSAINQQTTFLPSATTNGELQKKWIITPNKTRALVKGNYGKSFQQSFNEAFVTLINSKQNHIPFTTYNTFNLQCMSNKGIGCICENYCNENVESFSAYSILQNFRYRDNMGYYKSLCYLATDKYGLNKDYVQNFLDYQILLDFVVTNLDRHMNNISLIRNANSLQVIGFAPIYDCGNSMFWNFTRIPQGTDILRLKASTFNESEVKNLRYVHNRNLLNIELLPTEIEVKDFYSHDETMNPAFLEDIIKAYMLKIEYLREFQRGVPIWDIPRKKGFFNE